MSENTSYNYGTILIWLAKLGEARASCLNGYLFYPPSSAAYEVNGESKNLTPPRHP